MTSVKTADVRKRRTLATGADTIRSGIKQSTGEMTMSTKRRFSNQQTKRRIRKNKPVWLWKWTADGRYKGKQKRYNQNVPLSRLSIICG